MADELDKLDPNDVAAALMGPPATSGIRKLCMSSKKCGLGMSCEHAQHRDMTVEMLDAWTSRKMGDCENYFPRLELQSTGDVPRKAPGNPKRSRHNQHAPDREQARKLIGFDKQPPDLMVSRHIKHGHDIKKDD